MIDQAVLTFLDVLAKNNNREWFIAHKNDFIVEQKKAKTFFKQLQDELSTFDAIEGHHLMRIYRDVRFSKDKTPYKPRFAGSFSRATAIRRGSYYLNIEPGNSIIGGGFYGPNTEDLKRIRQEFEMDSSEIRVIMNTPRFKTYYGDMQGEELKSAPRGFYPLHPSIDLIRKKQFYFIHQFSDAEVLAPDFISKVSHGMALLLPYFDLMSSILTTNTNGESIL